jgi:hypothetical protein
MSECLKVATEEHCIVYTETLPVKKKREYHKARTNSKTTRLKKSTQKEGGSSKLEFIDRRKRSNFKRYMSKNSHYYRSLFGDVPIDKSFNELSRLGFTEEVFEIFEENDKWQE